MAAPHGRLPAGGGLFDGAGADPGAGLADVYKRQDEPRPISYKDNEGNTVFEEISRYDFLKQDEDGQFYWDDQFLFSCDTSAPLASNREAMWQETRMNLQTGAFGDPSSTETLILFWSKMEELHYPGAGSTKKYLEERLRREQQQAAQEMGIRDRSSPWWRWV